MPFHGLRIGVPGALAGAVPSWVLRAGGVLPANIDANFAGGVCYGGAFADLFSCSRASSGYVTNTDGSLSLIPANTPRIGLAAIGVPASLSSPGAGLLVEEARTNSSFPSVLLAASWTTLNAATLTDSAGTALDGTNTAGALMETTANNAHFTLSSQFAATPNAQSVTISVYVKPNGRTWCFMRTNSGLGNNGNYFNLSGAGSIGATTVGTVASNSIVALANGWYRISVTVANASGSSQNVNQLIATALGDNQVSFTGDASLGLLVWGSQIEVGAFPTSYIPTTTVAVTRAADVVTPTGALLNLFTGSASSVVIATTTSLLIGTSGNIYPFGFGSNTGIAYTNVGNGRLDNINGAVTLQDGSATTMVGPNKAGIARDVTGRSLVLNNGTVSSDANDWKSTAVSSVWLGSNAGGNSFIDGYITRLTGWNSRLAAATFKALTA